MEAFKPISNSGNYELEWDVKTSVLKAILFWGLISLAQVATAATSGSLKLSGYVPDRGFSWSNDSHIKPIEHSMIKIFVSKSKKTAKEQKWQEVKSLYALSKDCHVKVVAP